MKQKSVLLFILIFCSPLFVLKAQKITMGADQTALYLPLLKNKNIALMVNPTSTVGSTHLVDTLLSLGINIKKIFSPEHGFRGTADAGELVKNSVDPKTNVPIVSLYGSKKKPTQEQLKDIDIVLFDIQDIGVRFFTYVGSMHYLMQSCADYGVKLIVFDRPNPNGYYVDGPVLDMKYKSFIGMHPVPVVHGLTVGEYAKMINGEKWLDSNKVCDLTVIPMKGYTHKSTYSIPIKLSPNMPNDLAVQLYPSLCLFEGTNLSMGRGTDAPFQIVGAPRKEYGNFEFTPTSREGAKKPLYENQICYGIDFRSQAIEKGFYLKFIIDMYRLSPEKDKFFNDFFTKLAGNEILKNQIVNNMSEELIRKSWEPSLSNFKVLRKKYLLYADF